MLRIFEAEKISTEQYKQLLLRQSDQDQQSAQEIVLGIIGSVAKEGLSAVQRYTKQFDGVDLAVDDFIVTEEEYVQAEHALDRKLKEALKLAAANITTFHRLQKENLKDSQTSIQGTQVGFRYLPIENVGIYVPGGLASYPSSVLMGLIPAKIAGVKNCILLSPPSAAKGNQVDAAVLYCARLAGASQVLKVGGAQGVAAAAYGLLAPAVSLIVGPGNRYVTAAKTLLTAQGKLRMDLPAGPSEVIVIADDSARADFVAADLLSQAEHGADSPAVLLTNSMSLAQAVCQEIEKGIKQRPARQDIKSQSICNHSFAIVFSDLQAAYDFANEYGPEHLELCVKQPEEAFFTQVKHAGSVFLGHYAPVALGDYYSGTNHILPTGGAARFYSGLGVDTFLKRVSYQYPTKESLKQSLQPILAISRHEGLEHEHGHSVAVRFSSPIDIS